MAQALIAIAGVVNRVTAAAGTVYGVVAGVLTSGGLDFSDEDNSHWISFYT